MHGTTWYMNCCCPPINKLVSSHGDRELSRACQPAARRVLWSAHVATLPPIHSSPTTPPHKRRTNRANNASSTNKERSKPYIHTHTRPRCTCEYHVLNPYGSYVVSLGPSQGESRSAYRVTDANQHPTHANQHPIHANQHPTQLH